jgi:hypothetical protein
MLKPEIARIGNPRVLTLEEKVLYAAGITLESTRSSLTRFHLYTLKRRETDDVLLDLIDKRKSTVQDLLADCNRLQIGTYEMKEFARAIHRASDTTQRMSPDLAKRYPEDYRAPVISRVTNLKVLIAAKFSPPNYDLGAIPITRGLTD